MSLQFVRDRPVQAAKLVAIVATLLFAVGGVFGVIPDQGLTSLFPIVLLSLGLLLVILVETLLAGYRSTRGRCSLADQFAEHRAYILVRAVELLGAIITAGGFVFLIVMLPDEAPAGPGAIGLLFILVGLGLVVLASSLLRTVTEYYYYRHTDPV